MGRAWMLGLMVLCMGAPAIAAKSHQLDHSVKDGRNDTTLQFSWQLPGHDKDSVTAVVSTEEVDADKAIKRHLQVEDMFEVQAKAARQAVRSRKNVDATVKQGPTGVRVEVKGPPKAAQAAMEEAEAAMEASQQQWLAEHQVFELQPGVLSYDHAAVVVERTHAVAPVAAALREGTTTPRAFLSRTLGFTQSIPYQKARRRSDSGFQRPLALLARNKGDCDGKSTLFLSLVRAELPDVPLIMVYLPGHALVGLGITPEDGDRSFTVAGQTYVFAEPVGPGALPLGQVAPTNIDALDQAFFRAVP